MNSPVARSLARGALRGWRVLAIAAAGAALAVGIAAAKTRDPALEPPAWPPPPEPARVRFVTQLRSSRDLGHAGSILERAARSLAGAKPRGLVALTRPTDVWAADSSRIFVSDASAAALYRFDAPSRSVRRIGASGPGALSKPMGLGGDESGRVYVADPPNRRVVEFDTEGRFVRALGGRGELLNPVDVAVEPATGRVWVVDAYLHQVVIFDSSGAVWKRIGRTETLAGSKEAEWHDPISAHEPGGAARGSRDARENRGGGPGEFLYPASVARSPSGRFFVTDGLNGRVQSFDPQGRYVATFGRLGDAPGSLPRPKGIACDSQGHVYVVDAAFNNIQVFDERGTLLLAIGGLGQEPGRFWLPMGLHIDRHDYLYVADRYNERVQILRYLPDLSSGAPGHGAARDSSEARTQEGGRP